MEKQTLILLIIGGVLLLFYTVFFAVVVHEIKKYPNGNPKPKKYDERQLADRAKAVQCAFWTMCVYLLLWGVLEAGFGIILWENAFGAFLGVILGIGVFSIVCVLRDAYFRPGDKNE